MCSKKLLRIIPKSYTCPYCGEHHNWGEKKSLECYDSAEFSAKLRCPNLEHQDGGDYRIYFRDEYFHYSIKPICWRANLDIKGKIPIDSMNVRKEGNESYVEFDVPYTTDNYVGKKECTECAFVDKCYCAQLSDDARHDYMYTDETEVDYYEDLFGDGYDESNIVFTLGFQFEGARKETKKESTMANNSFEGVRMEIKKENTMANNSFFMNMEYGPNRDDDIASTLMGIAVRNGNSWRIYDKTKNQITDFGEMKLGNFPIYIIPVTRLCEGDLIKDDGEYYFVTKSDGDNIQTVSARTGERRDNVPLKNVLGFSCYSKVISFTDLLNTGDDLDMEKLAIMSAMSGQAGEDGVQLNQLLPLIILKKDELGGGDDDMMNLLLMSSMMTSENDSDQLNQLLPLIILKKDELGGGDNYEMKLLLMSSMMGGNMATPNNPLMSYLMLKSIIEEKKGNTPQDK